VCELGNGDVGYTVPSDNLMIAFSTSVVYWLPQGITPKTASAVPILYCVANAYTEANWITLKAERMGAWA